MAKASGYGIYRSGPRSGMRTTARRARDLGYVFRRSTVGGKRTYTLTKDGQSTTYGNEWDFRQILNSYS